MADENDLPPDRGRPGAIVKGLRIHLEGEMKVFIEDDQGKELTVKILKPGDSFGELAVLKEYPEISLALIKSLANMVRETTEELGSIALCDVYGRLTHILDRYAVEKEGQKQVHKFTHREISNMIGSSREMVSKIMKELEKGNYISVTDKHYVINKSLPTRW